MDVIILVGSSPTLFININLFNNTFLIWFSFKNMNMFWEKKKLIINLTLRARGALDPGTEPPGLRVIKYFCENKRIKLFKYLYSKKTQK